MSKVLGAVGMGKQRLLMGLLGGLLMLGGCTTIDTSRMPGADGLPLLREDGVVGETYRIRPGDTLDIKLYTAKEYDESVVVRPDGAISMQRIQDLKAAGLTPTELKDSIDAEYRKKGVTAPESSVLVRSFKGFRVYVGGEVAVPQVVPLDGGMSVMQAVFRAGGFSRLAHPQSIVLIRKAKDGHPEPFHLDLSDEAIAKGKVDMSVALSPYDVIYVPRSPIANGNLWVEQYITNLILFKGMQFGYTVNRNHNSGDNSSDGSF